MKHMMLFSAAITCAVALDSAPLRAADLADSPDTGLYLALSGGWNHQASADIDVSGLPITGEIFFKNGWTGAVAVGAHATSNLRAEVELAVHQTGLDYEELEGVGTIDLDGNARVTNVLAKLLYDFGDGPVRPYVGAGIGLANYRVKLDAPIAGKDSDTAFAGALEAGLNYAVSPHAELFAAGQVLLLGDLKLDPTSTGGARIDNPLLVSTSVGVRWHF